MVPALRCHKLSVNTDEIRSIMKAIRLTAAAVVLGAGAALFGGMATATADTIPGCSAADVTDAEARVAAAMTGYLWTHPDVNDFLSSLQGSSKGDAYQQVTDYFNANPDVKNAVDAIRGPSMELRNRCGIPLNNVIRGVL